MKGDEVEEDAEIDGRKGELMRHGEEDKRWKQDTATRKQSWTKKRKRKGKRE